jgi:CBS domain containing-hemolysin-like protein
VVGEIVLLGFLLALSAFFSSSETAFTSLDRVRLETMERAGARGARQVGQVLARPGRMLSAILLGNNLVNTGSAAVGTLIAAQIVGEEGQAVLLATLGVTVLLMVFGEIGPKTIALHHDWPLARTYALPLTLWIRLMLPVVAAFDLLGRGLMRLVGGGSATAHLSVGELRTAIAMGVEAGALRETQSSMLLGALRLQDRPAAEIMVHRTQIAFVAAEQSIADAARLMQEHGVQRLPVYVRDTDEVVGVVRVADVAAAYADGRADATARDTMREVAFDSELASIAGVLERMQASGDHLVMLTDEFGSVAGLVTLEDVVEEVIGQIQSETGSEPEAGPESGGRGTAVIDGRTPLGELADQYDVALSYPGVQTIAGLVVRRLGRLPRVGELLRHGEMEITVIDVDARRVKSVAIRRIAPIPRRTD